MKNTHKVQLETKSVETKALGANLGNDGDVSEAFDEFMTAFSAFREANDERLRKVEKSADVDVLLREKVDRINRAIDEQKQALDQYVLKTARPQLGNGPVVENREHKQAFDGYSWGNVARLIAMPDAVAATGRSPWMSCRRCVLN